jgi:putative heme-binding domain-containing protein
MQRTTRSFVALALASSATLLVVSPAIGQSTVDDGRQIFERNCAICHGGDATGGRGPDLSRGMFRHATTDAQLTDIVQNGIEGTGMPWTGLSDQKASQVVAFIRSLSANRPSLPGDPENGRALFFGSGTCSTCHMVNGRGGRQGPDLSWIGWQRAPDFLRQSILDPSADVDPRWWTARAVTRSGAQIAGVLVDEDQFAVRILDGQDELHAVAKYDLESLERSKLSKMPTLGEILGEGQLDDLVAYLAGLRGGDR